MKKLIAILSIIMITSYFSVSINAQVGPPNPPGDPGSGGVPIGGSAPIGGGLFILLGLGAAYGTRKLYKQKIEDID